VIFDVETVREHLMWEKQLQKEGMKDSRRITPEKKLKI